MHKLSTIYHLRATTHNSAFTIVELPPSLKFRRASLVPNNNVKQGFTIVELLVVIVVIGILAAITIVSYTGISNKATVASLQADLSSASKLLKLDQVINSNYPASLASANSGKGIAPSSGTSYDQYIYNNNSSPQSFCITATKNSTSYKITNNSAPTLGTCQTSGIVTDGLILNLDAGNTASYPSPFDSTSWTDLSGSNNHGTLMNGVGYSSANGGVLNFDGVDDSFRTTNPVGVMTNFSIVFWVYPYNLTDYSPSLGDANGWGAFYCHASSPGSLYIGTDATTRFITAGGTLVINQWQYFVYTINNNSAKLYKNGVLLNSGTQNNSTTWTGFETDHYGAPRSHNLIPNVQIYNRALSSSEITQNFNATKSRYGL
jgi:prepilin-type N-terminal cleavage/methylation domain-containing protein